MRPWYRIENAADNPAVVDIHIIDFIGGWTEDWWNRNFGYDLATTARQFVDDLSKLDAAVTTINVHINSPGGDVFGALNIANALREQASKGRTVHTIVDGLAASAASVVMMAGSTVRMADNALVMIHNPWTRAVGASADLRKVADELDKVRGTIVATYGWHSSLAADDLVALMDAETWMDADEALARGFATEKVSGLAAAASITRQAAQPLNVPEQFRARVDAWLAPADAPTAEATGATDAPRPNAATAEEVLARCTDVAVARELIAQQATVSEVEARVAADRDRAVAAEARATEIRAFCQVAKLGALADGYIRSQMSPADVQAHLTEITAQLDQPDIDGGLDPDHGAQGSGNWKQAFARAGARGLTR